MNPVVSRVCPAADALPLRSSNMHRPRALAVATSLLPALGLQSGRIFEVGVPAPTRSGGMNGADVLILLGCDVSGRTLAELQAATDGG